MKVWKRFRKAGLLDEVSLEQKDRTTLLGRVLTLVKELFEYIYNMVLLLIERKEWISQYDEVREALAEAQECLKRDQSSNMISIFEVERREENLRNALGVKKQCVDDLENALPHELIASLDEKSLQVEAKLHAADAKLAEASQKSSEIERKMKEVETREIKLRSERQSLNAQREVNESAIEKQREEMGQWERTLQEREDRLIDGRRILNQREESANEMDRRLKHKQKDVDEIEKLVEKESSRLKQKEKDLDIRLAERKGFRH
ncbi:hypothetical protein MKW98_030055 [Papaver atlanticum]|uniref:Uncharacterized protein n=1 Tax=Papaver atlanticum TaxID=357466 RepID=A0AAD4T8Q0_9MAGN|nr:hypothetical protein MKW98_030055 [Papaver atlanticum]